MDDEHLLIACGYSVASLRSHTLLVHKSASTQFDLLFVRVYDSSGMLEHELKLWYLKQLDLFRRIPEPEMKQLDRRSTMRSFPPKDTVYFSQEDLRQIYLIKKGHVEIGYRDPEGRELVLDVLGPGDFFGALSVAGKGEGFARTLTETLLCILQEQDFLDFVRRYPDIALQVLRQQHARVRFLETRLQDLVFRDVQTRIRRLLATLYEKFGNTQTATLEIPLTHQEIAALVGCARETASLCLSNLKKSGVLDYTQRYIRILDPYRLREGLD